MFYLGNGVANVFFAQHTVVPEIGERREQFLGELDTAGVKWFCGFVARLPGLPAVNKVEPGALDVLNAHDAIEKSGWRVPRNQFHDLVAGRVVILDDDEFALEPVLEKLTKALIERRGLIRTRLAHLPGEFLILVVNAQFVLEVVQNRGFDFAKVERLDLLDPA